MKMIKCCNLMMHFDVCVGNGKRTYSSTTVTVQGRARTPPLSAATYNYNRRSCCSGSNSNSNSISTTPTVPTRRSGNYKPPLWDFNYIQSLPTHTTEDQKHSWRHADLIEQVKVLMQTEMEAVRRLELIDDLQRLGISYHFDTQIKQILNSIYKNYINYEEEEEEVIRRIDDDLYSTALAFRLLRDHGFRVSQGVFDCFKNENGDFRSSVGDDTRGVLQLYEASFLLTQGEETLEMAKEFANKILRRKLVDVDVIHIDEELVADIRKALELPIHWRIQRPNARSFIEAYGRRRRRTPQMNPILLQLAKLDFNILQSMHQQELKLVSSWWDETGLSEAMPFARDRVVECYVWTLGGLFQPQYGYSRIMATKINVLITIIDDIFDVYATWEELKLFNTAIQRWDVEAMDQLPKYMQMCFLALNSFINEMAYNVLKEQHILITQHLRNSWRDLCRTYTQEAEWYATGYKPTLDEYMSNAWISISAPVILTHAFFLITNPIQEQHIQSLYKYHHIVRSSSIILRLANDLGTSPYEMERGDVPKSIECYKNETGGSTEEGREHVRVMIWEAWKEMNEGLRVGKSPFSETFVRSAVDLGRMAQYMYQHGDGHGIQNPIIKDRISTLLFQPVQVEYTSHE